MAGSRPEISLSARAMSRSRLMPGKTRTAACMTSVLERFRRYVCGRWGQFEGRIAVRSGPELGLGPAQDELPVEEIERETLCRRDLVALRDDGGDHHIALVVECHGEHVARLPVGDGDVVGPAAPVHPFDGDRPSGREPVKFL